MKRISWIPAILLLVVAGCDFHPPDEGPLRSEAVNVEKGTADHANVEVDIGAGQLELAGGSDELMSGSLEYRADRKPGVDSSLNGTHAVVTIRQPSEHGIHGGSHADWKLKLNDRVVLDMTVNCGAGQANLSLGTVQLRSLDVHMGAGQVDLDLRGKPARDYEVNISGGVGQATVHLPQGVGIRADAHGGIGSVDVTGLNKVGDHYENDLYDKAKVNVRVKVEGGIGSISLIG